MAGLLAHSDLAGQSADKSAEVDLQYGGVVKRAVDRLLHDGRIPLDQLPVPLRVGATWNHRYWFTVVEVSLKESEVQYNVEIIPREHAVHAGADFGQVDDSHVLVWFLVNLQSVLPVLAQ